MKNEQNLQNKGQNQASKDVGNNLRNSGQERDSRQSQSTDENDMDQPSSQNSNISVGNDGKIGQDDQWKTGTQEGQNQKNQRQQGNQPNQVRGDKSDTDQNTPIDDPEQTGQNNFQAGNRDKR